MNMKLHALLDLICIPICKSIQHIWLPLLGPHNLVLLDGRNFRMKLVDSIDAELVVGELDGKTLDQAVFLGDLALLG